MYCRRIKLEPAIDLQNIPGFYLQRVTHFSSSMKVKFAVKIVDRQNETKSIDLGEAGNLQVLQAKKAIISTCHAVPCHASGRSSVGLP